MVGELRQRSGASGVFRERWGVGAFGGALRGVGQWMLPRRCVVCDVPGDGLCDDCALSGSGVPHVEVAGFVAVTALFAYDDVGRAVVGTLKFDGRLDAVPVVASAMAHSLADQPHLVTWVPTSATRRRARGFDQAELLARQVARRCSAPAVPLVVRLSTETAHRLGRADRFATTRFAPRLPPGSRRATAWRHRLGLPSGAPVSVLVVDDVVTTGASLAAVGRAVESALAPVTLSAVTVAATPSRNHGGVARGARVPTGRVDPL